MLKLKSRLLYNPSLNVKMSEALQFHPLKVCQEAHEEAHEEEEETVQQHVHHGKVRLLYTHISHIVLSELKANQFSVTTLVSRTAMSKKTHTLIKKRFS